MSANEPLRFHPGRRHFLRLAAAATAMASGACSPPPEKILPYVHAQEDPGQAPRFYATAIGAGGSAIGVLVESNMGRPTKIEGNPAHPSSLGATDALTQGAVLQLWDPDRAQSIRRAGALATREELMAAINVQRAALGARGGEGLRVLTRYVESPTLQEQLDALVTRYPGARIHAWEPLNRDHALEGARLAFGRALEPVYRFDRTDVVVALDADFLGAGPGHVRYARDFMSRRRGAAPSTAMNRLYALETTMSLTGAVADHRQMLTPAELRRTVRLLAAALENGDAPPNLRAIAADLRAHRGRCVIVPGASLPAAAHAQVHALNEKLGAHGECVDYIEPVGAQPDCVGSLRTLTEDMHAGRVQWLVMIGGNPVYDAPVDFQFAAALKRVPVSLHLSLYHDETSAFATWQVPMTHALEEWGDARAHDGTVSVVQPLIAPLYGGLSPHALLSIVATGDIRSGYDIVRRHWQARTSRFEDWWYRTLQHGMVADSAAPAVAVRAMAPAQETEPESVGWTLAFREDPSVRDGEFANNAWLQELPRPDSKIAWDNAALIAPGSARQLGVTSGEVVEIAAGEQRIAAPVWLLPGQAEGVVTLALGYGRERAGHVGNGVGFNAYRLRTSGALWHAAGVVLRKTGRTHDFAVAQPHGRMEGREPVRRHTIADWRAGRVPAREPPPPSLYPEWRYDSYRWGMAIDLGACIGCNACTIACQAENNIPSVGKLQVALGREMHWIRVDRYYDGPLEAPRMLFQPVPCMHCENAPCEEVCPVGATVHDSEGINVQVYNRCVGTRFCSNNCPYKVRRFNFLQYADRDAESLKGQRNPEVTVRMRGVMEKCNYCLQRITRARIESEKLGRRIRDGEVVTACQAVCPTHAIVFGDLNDRESAVNAAKRSPLDYTLLAELNTVPRTTYAARLVNPNPEMPEV
ncbi:MAG TPA: 4Fe-4S dicluster domain-containing protein [Burkholderiales bacterium]|nr:4Fe-4S dicluster domain-containing protein [Burkholderiales bacterium]